MYRFPYKLELTAEQLQAVGQVAAQWSFLESLMDLELEFLEGAVNAKYEPKGQELTFKKRVKRWRDLVDLKFSEPDKTKALDLINRAAGIKHERDKIIHANWGRIGEQVDNLDSVTAYKDGRRSFEWELSTDKITEVAAKISRINRDLILRILPGAPAGAWSHKPRQPN